VLVIPYLREGRHDCTGETNAAHYIWATLTTQRLSTANVYKATD